ncbi:hypothetical protein CCHR01_06293 [Colletotrichum chrysophilum]|uniref:Uncharacterized protein n=1 Tax=Colletotrichum chrysophilum TaxID=1836956 RepID=A0AAD9AR02_9PEZI|nr:hypothetical protein CCHR01_06293 [Colletotrichum chrysophilum]
MDGRVKVLGKVNVVPDCIEEIYARGSEYAPLRSTLCLFRYPSRDHVEDEITTDFRSRSAEQAANEKLAFERLKPSVSTFCSGMMSFGPFAIGGSLSLQGVEKSPRPHSAMAAGSPRSRRTEFRHDVVRRHISAKLGGWPEYGPIVETPTRRFSRL